MAGPWRGGDGAANPFHHTVAAFERQAKRLGVLFHEGEGATDVTRSAGAWQVTTSAARQIAAPILLNCAGA